MENYVLLKILYIPTTQRKSGIRPAIQIVLHCRIKMYNLARKSAKYEYIFFYYVLKIADFNADMATFIMNVLTLLGIVF